MKWQTENNHTPPPRIEHKLTTFADVQNTIPNMRNIHMWSSVFLHCCCCLIPFRTPPTLLPRSSQGGIVTRRFLVLLLQCHPVKIYLMASSASVCSLLVRHHETSTSTSAAPDPHVKLTTDGGRLVAGLGRQEEETFLANSIVLLWTCNFFCRSSYSIVMLEADGWLM